MEETLKNKFYGAAIGIMLVCLSLVTVACTPSQIQTAQQITQIAITDIPPVLQILVATGVLGTAQEVQAQKYAAEATADYQLVQTLISDYKANPTVTTAQKIRSAILAGNSNLQSILTAFHVADPQKEAAISGAIGLIVANMVAIMPVFPVSATASAVQASNQVILPSPKAFEIAMNSLLGRK